MGSYIQEENHYDYLIREDRMKNLKRHGKAIKYLESTMEQ